MKEKYIWMRPNKYSWKERYKHAFTMYTTLWNSAKTFFGNKYGGEALNEYFHYCLSDKVVDFSLSIKTLEEKGVEEFLKGYLGHLAMIGNVFEVIKADPEEIIIENKICGSKKMLIDIGQDVRFYCNHCKIVYPVWKQVGYVNEVEITGDYSCTKKIRKLGRSV